MKSSCRYPIIVGEKIFPCGQCNPCRLKKRREWTHRIMLEAAGHSDNCFATLTYSDENLPEDASLSPKHLQDWFKRFRKAIEPARIRYFACGEYGDESERPHYHVIIFGYPNCTYGKSQYTARRVDCCPHCNLIRDTWGLGHIFVGQLTIQSARYCAGYVMKKMTSVDDQRLAGRYPEFARQSRRPGLGADFMHEVGSTLMSHGLDETLVDVPMTLRHGSQEMPLGRYLRRRLREVIGRSPDTPKEVLNEIYAEMHTLREDARKAAKENGSSSPVMAEALAQEALDKSNSARRLRAEFYYKLKTMKGGSL